MTDTGNEKISPENTAAPTCSQEHHLDEGVEVTAPKGGSINAGSTVNGGEGIGAPDDAAKVHVDAALKTSEDKAEIERLAKLSDFEYARVRKDAAKKLGVPVGVLDKAVASKRDKPAVTETSISRKHWIVEPWPDQVDLAQLLDEIYGQIVKYMKVSETTAVVVTLWVVHTWVFDAMDLSPYLNIRSPAPECGKSRLLKLIYLMGHLTYLTSNISVASIFRVIDACHPTLLMDETDTFLGENEEARGILDAGHTRLTAYVTRTVEENGKHVARDFSTWGPKVFCGIGELATTLAGRSIAAELQRKKTNEKLPRLLERDTKTFADIRSKAARWKQDNFATLQKVDAENTIRVPENLSDRTVDNWRPLFAIADLAGDEWARRARNAALALSGVRDVEGIEIQVLQDIREVFLRATHTGASRPKEKMRTWRRLRPRFSSHICGPIRKSHG
jgi:putative DNA primase/helicase